MKKELSKWLEKIGDELSLEASCGMDGTRHAQTNFEALCRLIWKQALGYVETVNHGDKEVHRVHPPDLKAQALILERLEGKPISMDDVKDQLPQLLGRLDAVIKDRINKAADGNE